MIGRTVANEILEDIRRRVPNGTGWLSIYRKALQFWESSEQPAWMVLGWLETALNEFPAETSLATMSFGDDASGVVAAYNPWPIDMIPPISGGYNATLAVRPASDTEVEQHRQRVHSLTQTITQALKDAGAAIKPGDAMLEINGKVEADISFLGKRLEYGLGGLPRLPHWLPAALSVRRLTKQIANTPDLQKAVNTALAGGFAPAPAPATITKLDDLVE